MPPLLKVGTCGWSVKGGRKAYFERFKVIEVQKTFYRLPKLGTLEEWRREAPEGFEFTVKAWQVITHPPSSPTWRRAGIKVGEGEEDKYGYFRPTDVNFEAWERVKEACRALKAKICVFQTPPSFSFSKENSENVRAFFGSIDRGGLLLAWEPRGDWYQHETELRRLLEEVELIHVVDPLRRRPLIIGDICYFRLHGLGGREVNYRYKYSSTDLRRLLDFLGSLKCSEAYVLFNNIYMAEDASSLKQIAIKEGFKLF